MANKDVQHHNTNSHFLRILFKHETSLNQPDVRHGSIAQINGLATTKQETTGMLRYIPCNIPVLHFQRITAETTTTSSRSFVPFFGSHIVQSSQNLVKLII